MSKKTAAQLDREIIAALAGKPACAGVDATGITTVPFTEARHRSAAEFDRCYLSSVLAQANGSISEAARISGVERSNFKKLLHRHKIHSGQP